MTLDPRTHAYRPDLAAASLQGRVDAERFTQPSPRQVAFPVAEIMAQPRFDAGMTSQALMGAQVDIFEEHEGWAWGQTRHDGYVGYLPANALTPNISEPTHRICVPSTFLYPAASVKVTPVTPVYLNSAIVVTDLDGIFARLADGRFVIASHLMALDEFASEPAEVAEQFEHVPYLWGGITQAGLDCSGLIQLAFHASGRPCPRDSDMMAETVGAALLVDGLPEFRRGDLLFWQGHVGMMLDNDRIVHANGHHMLTVIEPVGETVRRIAEIFGPLTGVRRPD